VVSACDVSQAALETASINSKINDAEVSFFQIDILESFPEIEPLDVVVSNPPYIPDSEASSMSAGVTEFEPHLALFVPNEQRLIFYQRIAQFALTNLKPGGILALEIHENHGTQIKSLLTGNGFTDVQVLVDMQGKERIITAKSQLIINN
jgi:release factor glutamine methyltransferase